MARGGRQQRAVAEDLDAADALLLGVGDPVLDAFVQQRLAEIVEMDFAASGCGALVDELRVERVVHRRDGPLHFAMGADDASGVAGVGRFEPNDGRKASLDRVEDAADGTT